MRWGPATLDSLCSHTFSGGTPSTTSDAYYGGDIPWLRTQEVIFGRIFDTEIKITEAGLKNSSAKWVPERSVIVAMYGNSAGRSAINEIPLTTNQACCNLVIDPDKADYRYVFYALLRSYEALKGLSRGAAQNNLNAAQVKAFTIPAPSVQVQRHIGDTLSTYDDLIENNRRRMALLEESARLLYREWFVRLRFPGHEHTRITDGVPDGWEKAKVGTLLAKAVKGKKIQRGAYLTSGSIPCIDQGTDFIGGYTDDEEARISDPLPLIVFGDHTRILKFVGFPFAIGADGTQLICSNTPRVSPEYFYFALKEIDLSNYFYARHFKFLKEESVMIPVESLVREFSKFAASNFEQINYLRTQNQKLRAARDLLLPRLMSGEISV